MKICQVMDTRTYEIPNLREVKQSLKNIKNEILQSSKILKQTNISILDLLNSRIGEVILIF